MVVRWTAAVQLASSATDGRRRIALRQPSNSDTGPQNRLRQTVRPLLDRCLISRDCCDHGKTAELLGRVRSRELKCIGHISRQAGLEKDTILDGGVGADAWLEMSRRSAKALVR